MEPQAHLPDRRTDPIAPDVLADLMVASALTSSADVIALRSHPGGSRVSLAASGRVLGRLEVPVGVAFAAAARLSLAAGLAPPLPRGRHAGGVARLRASIGDQTGEIVISVGAQDGELDVQLQPLLTRPPESPRYVHLRRCPRCGAFQPPQQAACEEDGAPLVDVKDDPIVGGTIGAYRVRRVLGQGSMGVVFDAEHALLGRPVAIKVLHAALASDIASIRRFLREARAASRFSHPSLLEVKDLGVLEGGRPFMVMERLSGETLAKKLTRDGALAPRAALLLAREIALALDAAHAAGVVHNDLKPSNVVLVAESTDEAPRLKLVDFGAASVSGEVSARDNVTVGTPHYMSPERVVGYASDHRADIYSLGVVLFEMLSGRVPFTGETNRAVLAAQVMSATPSASSPFGALPARVQRLLGRAMAKRPEDRTRTMREVRIEIDAAIEAVTRARRWQLLG